MSAALALFLLTTADKADDALRAVETQQAEQRGKREKSLEAIEKAIRHEPAECPRCPRCEQPRVIDVPPVTVKPADDAPVSAEAPRVPSWVWAIVAGAVVASLATGVGIGVGVHK